MPKGKTHIKINHLLALPAGTALLYFAVKPKLAIMSVFFLSLLYDTFVFNPDLDLARYVKPFSFKREYFIFHLPPIYDNLLRLELDYGSLPSVAGSFDLK
ncbi:MAG: DUF2227 family putative metal-binding protein [Oligoflexia bacterium]|nr:DUF2227 family putative metal-binding protein [Oligoflexia bacterium]